MKAISTPLIITSIRAKKDGSIGFSGETPEYTKEEKIAFFDLQGVYVNALFEPEDSRDVVKVDTAIDGKTPSQRLRSVMHVWWRQTGQTQDFELFYRTKMDKIIDQIKEKLN